MTLPAAVLTATLLAQPATPAPPPLHRDAPFLTAIQQASHTLDERSTRCGTVHESGCMRPCLTC